MKFIKWLVINAFYLWLLYAALVLEIPGAWNVLEGLIVVVFVIGILSLSDAVRLAVAKDPEKPSYNPPSWIRWTLTGISFCSLLWFGHGAMATLYIIGASCLVATTDKVKELRALKAKVE